MLVYDRSRTAKINSIRNQVRGSIYEGFDLAAVATVVDIGRHLAEINLGHTATRPLGLIDMWSF